MYFTAHRGFDDYYPENTRSGIGNAARTDGVDAVEFDVRRCGSGELVVIHHDHVGAVSESHGDVDELSASELASISVEGSGEGVPELEEVLDVVPPAVGMNVELKEIGLAEEVLEAVSEIENDVLISALDANVHALWETCLAETSVPLACNFSVRPKEDLEIADLIGCSYANPNWAMCLVTDVIDRAHERGMAVHAWPVGSRIVAEALRRRGVDGIIASTPAVARPIGQAALDGRLERLYRSVSEIVNRR
jgi:glycerophosphoryl diester phosphodiesterase